MPDQTPFAVDLTNCEREPIHVLGTIQPFGFLIAVSTDWLIARTSANVAEFLGVASDAMLGRPIETIILGDAVHAIRNRAAMLRGADAVERVFGLRLQAEGPTFDVAIHFSGPSIVIEAEPATHDQDDAATLVRAMVSRLGMIDTLAGFYREGARQIRALTGFDRVMVYRFDPTGSGEVVAEALRAGVDSFYGLNYPASDIPAQARALYLRSTFRIIADVTAVPVPILPALDMRGDPLDQSLSVLRAVSPIHVEYLRNMGVGASLSISIIVDGRLWGLFACHHYGPRLPSFAQRSAAELFGQMFSLMLEGRERRAGSEYETQARMVADRLMAAVAADGALLTDAQWLGEIIADTIPADGVGVMIDGAIVLSGLTPDRAQFQAIATMLNQQPARQVFATDCISALIPGAASYAHLAAGLVAIPLSRSPRDYVVLFRSERLRSVRWAGNPEKSIEYGPNGARLTPRKSFEEWSELVKGKASPFTVAELRVAEALRIALLEVVLRLSDAAGVDRKRAQDHQEMLIAELNHRVRNILSLIRGLISQSRDSSLSAEQFVATLDHRIQALARAHDQITADRWGPARLIDLILTESGAYLGAKQDRVRLSGPNVLIDPTAFTTLALVFHELMTNAAKYGALADGGQVAVDWRIDGDGSLLIDWREIGGPPVRAPTRRGFGSTVIESSVPYDLGGHVDIDYAPGGLQARFCVPSRFVATVLPDAEPPAPIARVDSATSAGLLDGLTVLLVEDSLIIALDGEEALRTLGASEVVTASSVLRAVTIVDDGAIDFAVLDFNLGAETSLGVAELLHARSVPFVFATGYGDALDVPAALSQVGIVKKPYNVAGLATAIAAAVRRD